MKIRIQIIYGLLGLLCTTHADLFAVDIKQQFSDTASAISQGFKNTGTFFKNIPLKVQDKMERWALRYWAHVPSLKKVAHVRTGIALSSGEKKALAQRTQRNTAAIQKGFGNYSYTPKVAVLCSGGGYRAMFITLGFLSAAQKMGLLDMVTWLAGVSGGTWGIGSVMAKALSQEGVVDISSFAMQQAVSLDSKSLKPVDKTEYQAIGNILMAQSVGHQLFTTINMFGALLANRLFGFLPPEDRQRQRISQQSALVKTGSWPIPIYTMVQYDPGLPAIDYRWVEANPWEYGGTWLHSYAPIWGNSRTYDKGVSTNFHVERSLGFMLGICGSAFAAEFKDVYQVMKEGLHPLVQSLVEQSLLPRYAVSRVTWGQLQNYTKGMGSSPLQDEQYLNLIDAGFTCNFPYQPLSGQRPERKPDVLILVDSSTVPVESLRLVERYAKKNKLKFPPIDYTDVDKRFISVFSDPHDADVPVVIYLLRMTDHALISKLSYADFKEYEPWVANFDLTSCIETGPCVYTNFKYTQQTILQLIKTIEFQTMASKPIIFDAIKKVLEKKQKKPWWNIWRYLALFR